MLGDLNYYWFEEPIPDRQHVPAQAPDATQLDGADPRRRDAARPRAGRADARSGAFDIARGDVHLKEGITGLRKAVGMADLLGFDLEVHGIGQPLLECANLHVSLAMTNGRWCETLQPDLRAAAQGRPARGRRGRLQAPARRVPAWASSSTGTGSTTNTERVIRTPRERAVERRRVLLRGVRVVDGRGVRAERADVLIADGRIAQISDRPLEAPRGAAASSTSTAGRSRPGLMNAHAHICLDGTSPDPEAILRTETPAENAVRSARPAGAGARGMGVTAIRDVGAPWGVDIALRRLVERGEIPGPRMVTAGRNICMTGGHGNWMGLEADGPDGLRARRPHARSRPARTAIKLMSTGGMMTPNQVAGAPQLTVEEMTAACEEAHKAGFPVAAHAESDEGVRNAVLAGVDSVEHGHGATVETLQLMLDRGTSLTPTILSDRRDHRGRRRGRHPAVRHRQVRAAGRRADRDAPQRVPARASRSRPATTAARRWSRSAQMADELALYVEHGLSPQ